MISHAERFRIEGRVQGVGYRWWAVGQARRLGLRGWVRNLTDGAVELLAIGPAEAINRLALSCALGPDSAQVSAVLREPAEDDGALGFEDRPTA